MALKWGEGFDADESDNKELYDAKKKERIASLKSSCFYLKKGRRKRKDNILGEILSRERSRP